MVPGPPRHRGTQGWQWFTDSLSQILGDDDNDDPPPGRPGPRNHGMLDSLMVKFPDSAAKIQL